MGTRPRGLHGPCMVFPGPPHTPLKLSHFLLPPLVLSPPSGPGNPSSHTWQRPTHPSDLRGNVTALQDPPWSPLAFLPMAPRMCLLALRHHCVHYCLVRYAQSKLGWWREVEIVGW